MKKTIYKDPVCGRKLNRQKAHIAIDYEGITYYLAGGGVVLRGRWRSPASQ